MMADYQDLKRSHNLRTTKLAVKILIAYFTIYYSIPLLFVVFFGPSLDAFLRYPPSYFRGFLLILGVFLLTWFLIVQLGRYGARLKFPKIPLLFNPFISLFLSIIFVLLSIYFWTQFGLGFRQSGDRIGNTGALGILVPLYILTVYYTFFIIYIMGGLEEQLDKIKFINIASILLFISGCILSIQASSGIVLIIMGLIQIIRLTINKSFLRSNTSKGRIGTVFIITITAVLALFVGISNKIGIDTTLRIFESDSYRIFSVFQNRISYHLFSASFHATYNLFNLDLASQAAHDVFTNIQHRVDVLFGRPTIFNEVSSVKRLNYEQISWHPADRTGTAPGIVGGLFFYPFGLLSSPFICIFYAYMLRTIASLASRIECGIFDILYLTFIAGSLLDGSLDILNPLDPAFLRVILLLVMVGQVESMHAKRIYRNNAINKNIFHYN